MRQLIVLIALVALPFVSWSSQAGAYGCRKGDTLMGPNCINYVEWGVSPASGLVGPFYKTTVYRGFAILWEGFGTVTISTAEKIQVEVQHQGPNDPEVWSDVTIYPWQPTKLKYAIKP